MWLFLGILAVPLIEIALFVTLGGWLGLWLTLAIVLTTGVGGVVVIRWQGLSAREGLRQARDLRHNPIGQIADRVLIVFAGILLILPGFLTDALGVLLLIPPVRRLVSRIFADRVRVRMAGVGAVPRGHGPDIIDGEFFEMDQGTSDVPRTGSLPGARTPSGWTRH